MGTTPPPRPVDPRKTTSYDTLYSPELQGMAGVVVLGLGWLTALVFFIGFAAGIVWAGRH